MAESMYLSSLELMEAYYYLHVNSPHMGLWTLYSLAGTFQQSLGVSQ